MDTSALEAGLDAEQHRAVTSPANPLAVLAPAGSGKTRVLTRRIAHRVARGEIEPQHVLAVTFTRKAAGELRDRLASLGLRERVTSGTFHALALTQIREYRRDRGGRSPQILDRKQHLLEEIMGRSDRRSLAEIATEIEWAKARLIPPTEYADRAGRAGRRTSARAERVAEVYEAFESMKRDRHLLDFDDLLLQAAVLIEQDEPFARAMRWRFRHLFVDEFQDINPLQFRLLEAWRGERYDLFVVGDPQQAIYTWNGADPSFLLDIATHYPPIEVIRLRVNYRSSPQILRGAESVLRAAGLEGAEVVPTHADGDLPVLFSHRDERAEAQAIARVLRREAPPGRTWSSQAVLVRTHAQLDPIREALRAARIPHQVRGADRLIDHPVIRRILGDLERDERPVAAALEELEAIESDGELRSLLDDLEQRGASFAREHPGARGRELAAWLRITADRRSGDDADAVVLATFHAAKGLEWPIVHLAGLEAGFVPIGFARTREAKAEEARLLYVAMTRAERTLHLHMAMSRPVKGTPTPREPSPLLRHLPTVEPARDSEHDLEVIRAAKADLAAPVDSVDGLERAVLAWRDRIARRARLRPDAVLPDRVLRAIVAARPTDLDQLSAVEGLGPMKAERFGDELLDVIREEAARPSR